MYNSYSMKSKDVLATLGVSKSLSLLMLKKASSKSQNCQTITTITMINRFMILLIINNNE